MLILSLLFEPSIISFVTSDFLVYKNNEFQEDILILNGTARITFIFISGLCINRVK